ncbi:MAG: hypothetical protein JXB38_07210 [Anaerolineales bacterium]|nr:hypothetical protein [Anaerolineales bacterium]
MLLTTIQIALLIILPLLLYYRQVSLRTSQIVLFIAMIYVIWYATYSPLHELRHLLPAVVLKEPIIDIQLFPHFLQGELSGGHITTKYSNAGNEFIIVLFPYLTDILFAIFGAVLLTKLVPRSRPLTFGLLLTILVTSPLFDVVNNYAAFVLGAKNDFNAIGYTTSVATAHAIGIIGTIVTLGAGSLTLWWVLKKHGAGEQVSSIIPG